MNQILTYAAVRLDPSADISDSTWRVRERDVRCLARIRRTVLVADLLAQLSATEKNWKFDRRESLSLAQRKRIF